MSPSGRCAEQAPLGQPCGDVRSPRVDAACQLLTPPRIGPISLFQSRCCSVCAEHWLKRLAGRVLYGSLLVALRCRMARGCVRSSLTGCMRSCEVSLLPLGAGAHALRLPRLGMARPRAQDDPHFPLSLGSRVPVQCHTPYVCIGRWPRCMLRARMVMGADAPVSPGQRTAIRRTHTVQIQLVEHWALLSGYVVCRGHGGAGWQSYKFYVRFIPDAQAALL